MVISPSRSLLTLEFILLMGVFPLGMWAYLPIFYMLPVLWVMGLGCYCVHRSWCREPWRITWNRAAVTRAALWPILLRFAIAASLMTIATAQLAPELLFSFIRERPILWILVMALYPLLSVIAQEVIYRSFFFARYAALFTHPRTLMLASALAFGFVHIIFNNWVAPTLCIIGGWFFAQTYARSRSLMLVSIEHALYGDFIFTLGLGRFFYHGAVGPH